MTKNIQTFIFIAAVCAISLVSCRKTYDNNTDQTRNYQPIELGKYVTYEVDSIYYNEDLCTQYRTKSQMKYTITDTFTDRSNFTNKLSYIMDVYTRPYSGGLWRPLRVLILNPTNTGLNWTQDGVKFVKLTFPITEGKKWKGNMNAPVNDSQFAFLNDWDYIYRNYKKSYNTGYLNFDNTVTVLENDESVNYPDVDSGVAAYRTYSKAVYAYNVGLIYRELTHWTYKANNSQCVNGYSVTMKAIDHN